ncbi:hypothetical protein D7X33_17695, partial [Butyricicoccus sp. 1XD8-22]
DTKYSTLYGLNGIVPYNYATPVTRGYKKSLADTLADTEWKSETSTKFYVTLSDKDIKDLPEENDKVVSLLDEKDINYISIDTTSTKSLAQQIADSIEQQSLQVTTTYTDSNMKNAMNRIGDFVYGVVFPPEDPYIDIHVGVDDSQYSLASVQSAVTNILNKRLSDSGLDVSKLKVTTAALKQTTVNGQSVKKFNVSKNQDYYILFKDSALNTTQFNHMVGDLLLQDAYFVGVGNSNARAQFENAINKNMYRGKTFINPTDLNTSMDEISTYLIDTIKDREGEKNIYGTTEANKVLYEASYNDYENHPKFTERFRTIHEPTVFENDQGKTAFGSENVPEILTKVGLYRPTYQAQDNPLVGYSTEKANQFAEYRKWSNLAGNINIYIHRLPIPDFRVTVNVDNNTYSITNAAYDLDKESINIGKGKGIATQSFQWRKKGDVIWNDGLPPNPLAETVYEVKNEVVDFQNQKNTMIKELDPRNMPTPPVAEFIPNPAEIEQGDSVQFLNTSYDPKGDNLTAIWYYKKSTSSSYTQLTTGAYTNGVGNTNWSPTTDKLNSIGIYDIKLVVTDTEGLSDEVVHQVEVVEKSNTPPIACMNIPTPNYIGDTIVITSCASDPDGDPLSYTYLVTKPNGTSTTYSTGHAAVSGNGSLTIIANVHPDDLGTWTVKQTVNDGTEEATTSGQFVVLDQTIQGQVAHTTQWLKNIQSFNAENPSRALNLDAARGLVEFMPGEKFVLSSDENTTNRLSNVSVAIVNSSQGVNYQSMYGNAILSRIDNNTFSGSMWHESMIEQFLDGETLTFRFTGTFANGWVDTHDIIIKIRDESYWRQHTSY